MGIYTEVDNSGRIRTDLTDVICSSWRKYGKQPDPNKKDPNVASFFMGMALLDGSLYISVNETGANKKYISFYIPQDSIQTFVQRFGTFVQDLAKNGTANAPFVYKNKEGVDVSLNLYACIDKDMGGNKASFLTTKIAQGNDKVEFSCSLARSRSNFLDKGKDFFASIKAMSDAMYTTLVAQSNGLYIDHFMEVKKKKKSDWKKEGGEYKSDEYSSSSNSSSSSYTHLDWGDDEPLFWGVLT